MIIIISGYGGAGKSHVAKLLAKKLGYRHYSTGDFRRQVAANHGLTIDELNAIGEKEFWTDKECDDLTIEFGKTEDNVVLDSWLAWNFIPQAYKIYLTVDKQVAAERIFANQRPTEEHHNTVSEVYAMNVARSEGNRERYLQWYKVDIFDTSNYDYVVDTSHLAPEQVVEKLFTAVNECKSRQSSVSMQADSFRSRKD